MSRENARKGEDRGLLAAEYVLGVLELPERQRVRRLMAEDPGFAGLVAEWEERLLSLADDYPPVEPPAQAKLAIEARLFPGAAGRRTGVWNALGFWRPLALATSLLLLLVIGFTLWDGFGAPPPGGLIVSLQPVDSPVSFVALYEPDDGAVRLSPVSGEPGAGKDFELWLIEGDNPAISLGVLPDDGRARISLPRELAVRLVAGTTLAISLEPDGGSPTGVATGPVVAAGQARPI